MIVRSYLPNDLDIAAEDRPRTFMILSSRGAFFVRTGMHRSAYVSARPIKANYWDMPLFNRVVCTCRAPHRDAVVVCSSDRPGADRHPQAKRTFDPTFCPAAAQQQVGLISSAVHAIVYTRSLQTQDFMYRVKLEGHKVNLLLRRTSGIHLLSKDGVRLQSRTGLASKA